MAARTGVPHRMIDLADLYTMRDPELPDGYERPFNQWTESSCLARVTVPAILKYDERRHPDAYAEIRAKYDAPETE